MPPPQTAGAPADFFDPVGSIGDVRPPGGRAWNADHDAALRRTLGQADDEVRRQLAVGVNGAQLAADTPDGGRIVIELEAYLGGGGNGVVHRGALVPPGRVVPDVPPPRASSLAGDGAIAPIYPLPNDGRGVVVKFGDNSDEGRAALRRKISLVGTIFGFFLASYTGVLLSATALPFWSDARLMGALFLASGASTGMAAISLLLHLSGDSAGEGFKKVKRADRFAIVFEMATRRMLFGPITNPENEHLVDLGAREIGLMLPLVALVIWIGVQPNALLGKCAPALDRVLERVEGARLASAAAPAEEVR